MIIVSGTIQFAPSDLKQIEPHIIEVMAHTAKENGCICYRFCPDMSVEGLFQIYEEWDSEAVLERHLETDHIKAFLNALSDFKVLAQDVKVFEATKLRSL
ncbi:MAG: putative quinol monooxygenase [Hyphomicrobiales bacterium]